MKKTIIPTLLLPAILLAAGLLEAGTAVTVSGTEASLIDLPEIKVPCGGYLEVRVMVTNSNLQATRLRLEIPWGPSGHPSSQGFPKLLSVRRALTLAPQARYPVSLFFPLYGQPRQLVITGASGAQKGIALDLGYLSMIWNGLHETGKVKPPILLAPRIDPGDFIPFLPPSKSTPGGGGPPPDPISPEARRRRDLANLPLEGFVMSTMPPEAESWLSFSSFGAVVISRQGLEGLSPVGRSALGDWVNLGGFLVVTNDTTGDAASLLGSGLRDLPGSMSLGTVFSLAEPHVDASWWTQHEDAWMRPWKNRWNFILRFPDDFRAANSAFRIPSRVLFFFLLVFCILAGPASSIYLKKRKKPLWILWTTPLLAVLMSGGLIAFVMVKEGFSPLVRTKAVSILDEVHHRVYSTGITTAYTPRSHSRPMRLSPSTEIIQCNGRGLSPSSGLEIDWTEGQTIDGWSVARGDSGFLWRDVRDSSLRVMFKNRPDGAIEAFNALETPIRSLLLRDGNGGLYVGGAAEVGKKLVLLPVREIPSWRKIISPRNLFEEMEKLGAGTIIEGALPPENNTYIAVVSGCPFFDLGIGRIREVEDASIVLGVLDPGDFKEAE